MRSVCTSRKANQSEDLGRESGLPDRYMSIYGYGSGKKYLWVNCGIWVVCCDGKTCTEVLIPKVIGIQAVYALVFDSALKKDDFPTLGTPLIGHYEQMHSRMLVGNKPTIPILRLFPGRPSKVFFSGPEAFFGGICFFAQQMAEVVNEADKVVRRCWKETETASI